MLAVARPDDVPVYHSRRSCNLGNFAQIYLCTHLCSVHVMMLIPILLLLLPAGSVSLDNILSTLQNNSEIQSTTEYARGAAGLYPNLPAGIIDILRPGGLPYGEPSLCKTCKKI